MSDFDIRPACTSDAKALVRLINLAFVAESPYIRGERIDLAGVLEFFSKGTLLVQRDRDALVGCVFIGREGEDGYVGLLSVDPAYQGKGLGGALMAAAEQTCVAEGQTHVQLRFINHRDDLLRFYSRRGYAQSGTVPFPHPQRMKVPFYFIQMSKRLV
jgi:GNAT superfamily N-acetyltransferase